MTPITIPRKDYINCRYYNIRIFTIGNK